MGSFTASGHARGQLAPFGGLLALEKLLDGRQFENLFIWNVIARKYLLM